MNKPTESIRPALLALILSSLTTLTFAQTPASDMPSSKSQPTQTHRVSFSLSNKQEAFVRRHMHTMLHAIANIQGALAENNVSDVKTISEKVIASNETKPEGIGKHFPVEFRQLSKGMMNGWSTLANKDLTKNEILQTNQQILGYCNACHANFKLE